MNWFSKLNERQAPSREHVRLRNSDSIILFIFFKAFHEILKFDCVPVLEQRHEISHDFDENRFLFFQYV